MNVRRATPLLNHRATRDTLNSQFSILNFQLLLLLMKNSYTLCAAFLGRILASSCSDARLIFSMLPKCWRAGRFCAYRPRRDFYPVWSRAPLPPSLRLYLDGEPMDPSSCMRPMSANSAGVAEMPNFTAVRRNEGAGTVAVVLDHTEARN